MRVVISIMMDAAFSVLLRSPSRSTPSQYISIYSRTRYIPDAILPTASPQRMSPLPSTLTLGPSDKVVATGAKSRTVLSVWSSIGGSADQQTCGRRQDRIECDFRIFPHYSTRSRDDLKASPMFNVQPESPMRSSLRRGRRRSQSQAEEGIAIRTTYYREQRA